MTSDLVQLGKRIRELREASGLSIAKAARRVGISAARWHGIEHTSPSSSTKKASVPSVPTLRIMADVIGGDRVELLELAGYEEDAVWDRVNPTHPSDPELAASGVDLAELRERDPDAYQQLVGQARFFLERARARGG